MFVFFTNLCFLYYKTYSLGSDLLFDTHIDDVLAFFQNVNKFVYIHKT
jgi:hypothetical protein